ncbi:MAG: hypothetical protein ACPIOQ_85715, partial [Promethearchaeia archaeon]
PGPQTTPKYRINEIWAGGSLRSRFYYRASGLRLRRALGANTSCSLFLSRENPQAIVLHSHKIGVITLGHFYYGSVLARAA